MTKVSPQPHERVFVISLGFFVEWISASRGIDFSLRALGGTDFAPIRGMDFRLTFCSGTDFDPVLEI